MSRQKDIVWLFFMLFLVQAKAQTGQALVLSTVDLLSDSSFTSNQLSIQHAGDILQITGRSEELHFDKTQNQKFYYYKVINQQNKTGWILGDELAILYLNPSKFVSLNNLTDGPYNIGKGFNQSVFYWGATDGKDETSSHFSARNEYHENYLVFVNQAQQAIYLPTGTQSERGDNVCKGIYLADLTGDNKLEIILFRSLSGKEMGEEVRTLEIYRLVDNEFRLIFDQRLNLYFAPYVQSPGRYKYVDISPDGIRLEYPQYTSCSETHFGAQITQQDVTYQKCMRWVTESYTWDKVSNRFVHFYEPTSLPFRGKVSKTTFLRQKPQPRSSSIHLLQEATTVKILAHLESWVSIKGQKVARVFFMVKTLDGTTGYLPSEQLAFEKAKHADLLNRYYHNPFRDKSHWNEEMDFVQLRGFQKESHWEVTGSFRK